MQLFLNSVKYEFYLVTLVPAFSCLSEQISAFVAWSISCFVFLQSGLMVNQPSIVRSPTKRFCNTIHVQCNAGRSVPYTVCREAEGKVEGLGWWIDVYWLRCRRPAFPSCHRPAMNACVLSTITMISPSTSRSLLPNRNHTITIFYLP